MNKKIITWLLLLTFSLSLLVAGCGKTPQKTDENTHPVNETESDM